MNTHCILLKPFTLGTKVLCSILSHTA
jgi:hypothetical protein